MSPEERAAQLYRDVDVRDGEQRWIRCVAAVIREVVAAEREACAKVADAAAERNWGCFKGSCWTSPEHIAVAIRARDKE